MQSHTDAVCRFKYFQIAKLLLSVEFFFGFFRNWIYYYEKERVQSFRKRSRKKGQKLRKRSNFTDGGGGWLRKDLLLSSSSNWLISHCVNSGHFTIAWFDATPRLREFTQIHYVLRLREFMPLYDCANSREFTPRHDCVSLYEFTPFHNCVNSRHFVIVWIHAFPWAWMHTTARNFTVA